MKKISVIIVILILAGLAVWWWGSGRKKAEPLVIDNTAQKAEPEEEVFSEEGRSPISGLLCENWNRRPLAIMYSGDMEARRNFRSLSQADFVLEMDHRPMHGQPRVMGVFQCASPTAMGPMRSGRTDHINVAASLGAIYVPWGGSSIGKNLLKKRVVDHIDCNGEVPPVGYPPACRKDPSLLVAPLRSAGPAFSNLPELMKIAEKVGYDLTASKTKGFPHGAELPREKRPDYGLIRVKQDYPYRVFYKYDPETNSYLRFLQKKKGAELKPDIDQATGKQYAPKNIITIITKKEAWNTGIDYKSLGVMDPWEGIDAEHRQRENMQYPNFQLGDPWFDTKFSGPARLFINGQDIKGTWRKKKGVNEPFRFYDNQGRLIKFVPGQIWMHVLAHDKHVSYDEEAE